MNYEEFKTVLIQGLPEYLPVKYKDWKIFCHDVVKVNGTHEALTIMPEKKSGGSPNLYLQELFSYYEDCGSIENVCQRAVANFVAGLDYAAHMAVNDISDLPKDSIIFILIPQAGNERLLANTPHRLTMDLAVIYRVVLEAESGGLNSAIVTFDMADEMGLTEEGLYQLAMENTPRIMGLDIRRCEGLPYMITNKICVSGASAILYPGVLADLAEELNGDLFILPSSLQEVFILPDMGQDIKDMNRFVRKANETVVGREEILADHVYYYHKATDQVCIPKWD